MKRLAILLIVVFSAISASADYITTFSTGASNDFQFAAIGQHGTSGAGGNNIITWNSGSVRLESRYEQPVSRLLVAGDNGSGLDDGKFNLSYADITASLWFDYYSGDSDTAFVEVALNANGLPTANNYPVYYAQVETNRFTLFRHQAYNSVTVVDSFNLASTVSGANLQLILSASDAGGGAVDLTAEFLQNGSSIASLSYSDPGGYLSGYAGFAGGDARNTGTLYGIDATSFSVGSVVPEPHSLVLLTLGLSVIVMRRRK
ncbi:MAG: PEP-CTERM sorting domain-containing protein [Verrucomicrobia bacterium]|nr:PEP-CTERM sorting domain-containing protein [Verrucomicrobiota bacterium]